MNTIEHLQGYSTAFSDQTLEGVNETMERIAWYGTHQKFLAAHGAQETKIVQYDGYLPTEVLDIQPYDYDPSEALFVKLPMANPLDDNQKYQVAAIVADNPFKRVIASGNPSGGMWDSGRLTQSQRWRVAGGDLSPVVDPVLRYADEQGIVRAQHIGGSYGADTAFTQAQRANYEVTHVVGWEPATAKDKILPFVRFLGTTIQFKQTEKHLEPAVQANELPTFIDARAESITGDEYIRGILKLSNIAIARCLARGGVQERLMDALAAQQTMRALVAWGSNSEFSTNRRKHAIVRQANRKFPGRIQGLQLEGAHHATPNYLPLMLAVIRHGLAA